jgi:non-ribosomal peptide synthetase component F
MDIVRVTYHTGDLARMRGDGVLEYHGRRDRMVKVRATKYSSTSSSKPCWT